MSAEPMAADDAPGAESVLSGRYRLLRLLGEGGMGRVFLADDEQGGGRVAVKLLADDRPIPKAEQRFEREARAIARIDHANVVRVTDVGQSPRGGLYYVMEYLEGEELASTLEREGPLPWPRVRHLALQICGALQAAHEAGIVHRDLKLENCFRVEREGDPDFVKILDFGVVKLLSPELDEGSARLTNTGATMGTPAYMAPELCRGKDVDHRVDVYALGVMLYELLTGRVPFAGDSFLDVALMHMNEPPPPLSRHLPPAARPAGLEAAVMRALAKAREDRFPSMDAFARALERVGEGGAVGATLAVGETLAAGEAAAEPLAAPGGTVPVLPAVSAFGLRNTEPAAASISANAQSEPLSLASVSISSATAPALAHGPQAGGKPMGARGVAWPWLAAGGLAAVSLLAWWTLAAPEPPPPEVEPAPLIEGNPVEPAPVKAAPSASEPEAEAPPAPAATPGFTEADPAPPPTPASAGGGGLSEAEINAALRRIRPQLAKCAGSLTGDQRGGRMHVVLIVARATGSVTKASASHTHRRPSVERCMIAVLYTAKFPAGGRGEQTIKRQLRL